MFNNPFKTNRSSKQDLDHSRLLRRVASKERLVEETAQTAETTRQVAHSIGSCDTHASFIAARRVAAHRVAVRVAGRTRRARAGDGRGHGALRRHRGRAVCKRNRDVIE